MALDKPDLLIRRSVLQGKQRGWGGGSSGQFSAGRVRLGLPARGAAADGTGFTALIRICAHTLDGLDALFPPAGVITTALESLVARHKLCPALISVMSCRCSKASRKRVNVKGRSVLESGWPLRRAHVCSAAAAAAAAPPSVPVSGSDMQPASPPPPPQQNRETSDHGWHFQRRRRGGGGGFSFSTGGRIGRSPGIRAVQGHWGGGKFQWKEGFWKIKQSMQLAAFLLLLLLLHSLPLSLSLTKFRLMLDASCRGAALAPLPPPRKSKSPQAAPLQYNAKPHYDAPPPPARHTTLHPHLPSPIPHPHHTLVFFFASLPPPPLMDAS